MPFAILASWLLEIRFGVEDLPCPFEHGSSASQHLLPCEVHSFYFTLLTTPVMLGCRLQPGTTIVAVPERMKAPFAYRQAYDAARRLPKLSRA